MTDIMNFDRLRVGSKFPVCFDITDNGPVLGCLQADINLYSLPAAQLLEKAGVIGLFVFKYRDEKTVPEWWQDAKVVWEYDNPQFDSVKGF